MQGLEDTYKLGKQSIVIYKALVPQTQSPSGFIYPL